MGTYNYSNSSKKYQNTSIDITNESLAYYQNRLGLFNDSMESKKGWMIYDSSVFSYDTTVASSGNVSLKVANTTSTEKVVNSEYWLQIDNAQPTEYTYSVKVKSDGTNPEAEIFLFMKTETETGSFTLVDQKVSATSTDWIEIEKTFLVPANIKKLNIRLDNNETGNLWFDDVRIRKTNQPTPTERELNITYNAFKSPVEIYEPGTDRISFDYNVFQSRSTMYYGNEETDKMLRKYRKHYSGIGSMEIKHDIETGEVEFVTYLGGDAYSASVVLKSDGTTQEPLYLHRDYLGSIVLITDKVGEIVEKRLFDAWGDIIQIQDGNNNVLTSFAVLDRGYTGHEHLQSVALVHMNGRLYDAKLHRFLQPDNFVQDPYNTQNYNRYGYVLNNPLKYTDPSGEFWHIVIGAVVGGVVNLTVKAFQGKINSWGDGFAAFGVGAVAGAVGAATGGAAYAAAGGGGFLAGAAGGAVGTAFASPIQSMGNTIFFNDPMMTGKQYVTGIFIGGVTGGLISGSVSAFKGNNFWTGNDVANGRSIFSLNNTSRYTPNNTSYNVSVDGVERVINSETISETLEGFGIEASFKNPIYKEVVDKYLGQMTNETFDLSKTNMAGGFMSKGNVQITSGHHRIIAATIRGMQTGDYSILEALIRNGRFDQVSNPSNYGYSFSKFPQIWK
jgi:RHS repeat-associated protein